MVPSETRQNIQNSIDQGAKPEILVEQYKTQGLNEEEIRPLVWNAIIHLKSQGTSLGTLAVVQTRITALLLEQSFIFLRKRMKWFLVLGLLSILSLPVLTLAGFLFGLILGYVEQQLNLISIPIESAKTTITLVSFSVIGYLYNLFVAGCFLYVIQDDPGYITVRRIIKKTIGSFKKLIFLYLIPILPLLFFYFISNFSTNLYRYIDIDSGIIFLALSALNVVLVLLYLVILISWILSPYILISENCSPWQAYLRSRRYMRKYFSDVLWFSLELALITMAFNFIPVLGIFLLLFIFIPVTIIFYFIVYKGLSVSEGLSL